MADPVTPNLGLTLPTVGADSGTWGGLLNTNLSAIDSKFGGVTALALTNANVTLSAPQYGNGIIALSGNLTSNVTVFFPVSIGSYWQIYNNCAGNFTVTLAVVGTPGTSFLIPVGTGSSAVTVLSDGTNIIPVNLGGVPVGTILPYGGASAPPGYLFGRGQNVGRVQFTALFNVYGTQYGSGDGSTTFGLPNVIGRTIVGIDTTGSVLPGTFYPNSNVLGALGGSAGYALGSVAGANENAFHAHPSSINDPGHVHFYQFGNELPVGQAGAGALSNTAFNSTSTTGAVTGITINNAASGAGQAHLNVQPSIAANIIIKF